ncbi:hypothetical protein MTO96_041745 [Rhipicephalus appendiculatus]
MLSTSALLNCFRGFLVVYLTLKRMKESKGKMNWWIFYLHRYWRLTPIIGLVTLFYAVYLPYCGDGPLWGVVEVEHRACKVNWWTNMLYVQNVLPLNKLCVPETWYVAADLQLYLIGPPIMYALYRKPRVGMCVIGLLFTLSTTYILIIVVLNEYPIVLPSTTPLQNVRNYIYDVYYMPLGHVGPYLVGIIAGYIMHTRRGLIVMKKLCTTRSRALSGPSALLGILICCIEGYGGPVNALLSSKFLVPLSRLTFVAYLVHVAAMLVFIGTREESFDFSTGLVYFLYIGYMALTYLLSLVVSLLFEAPIFNIEKMLLAGRM